MRKVSSSCNRIDVIIVIIIFLGLKDYNPSDLCDQDGTRSPKFHHSTPYQKKAILFFQTSLWVISSIRAQSLFCAILNCLNSQFCV
jgi:hypothetical protein